MSTDGSVCGETKMWARPSMLGAEGAPSIEGRYGKRLSANRPNWRVGGIGANIYQVESMIMRDIGNDTQGRKINSRRTAWGNADPRPELKGGPGNQCISLTGFSHPNERVAPRVLISPFEIYEIVAELNRAHQGRGEIRVGPSGKRGTYSALNIVKITSDDAVGNMDTSRALGEMGRIQRELPDPTFGYLRASQ